jgi:tetratricopeptide (TPR) repeat protein
VLLDGWSREEVHYIAERGYRLYQEGRLREAAILFAGLIVIDPEDAYCRKALAAISRGLGHHGLAVRHLSVVIERNRKDMDALAGRCEALLAMGDLDAAQRDLNSLAMLAGGSQRVRRLRLQFPAGLGFATNDQKGSQLPAGPLR